MLERQRVKFCNGIIHGTAGINDLKPFSPKAFILANSKDIGA